MRINGISNSSFKGIYIPNEPKQPKYLYNEVSDLIRKYRLPATFTNKYIELPRTTGKLIIELVNKGIIFLDKLGKDT